VRTLARWCYTHRIVVIAAWIVAVVGANALESGAGSAYTDNFKLPNTQSFEAIKLLERNVPKASGDTDRVVFAVKHGKLTDPAVIRTVATALANVAKNPGLTVNRPLHIAPGGQVGFASVTFSIQANKISSGAAKQFVSSVTSQSGHGVEFQVGGQIAEAGRANNDTSSLFIGFIAAAVVLFLVFGSFLAMLLPLLTAGLSLGTGIAAIGLLSHVFDMASFSSQLAALIGLGVGVDYALFVVTRYRQARLRGLSGEDAVVESLDTSGRAVLFAGMIVCIAMLGMFALGVSFLYGIAIAATVAVSLTALAALTLLPALLRLFERWVLRRRERRALRGGELRTSDESVRWARWTGWMEKRPAVFAAVGAGILVIIAIPFFSMRLGSADQGSDPANSTTRKAYDLLAKGFGPGYNGPLELVAQVRGPAQRAAFTRVVRDTARTPGAAGSTAPVFLPGVHGLPAVGLANVYPKGSPQDASTADLLHTVRGNVIPPATKGTGLTVLVGGQTAIFDDFSHVLSRKLPLFVGIVVLLSFLLLMAVFRSLVIPLTAALMNLLSAGAAFGLVTAIFQNGVGASLLGIDKTGPIEAFLPVLMFPILFGLSMDYEVFLVTRIYEEWHRRNNTSEAVSHGLAATGRTITAAAAIMVLVFGAFVLGGERVIELFGIGLGGAVLIDAVLVRAVVVPALMMLLGDSNWKIPDWLDRVLPRLNVEGAAGRPHDSSVPSGAVAPRGLAPDQA
jgi:RND superfamily putative drug exporter